MVHYQELVKLVRKDKKCVNVVASYVLVAAVMHWKRNTDIAQDRDESFPVSVSRRIVAIVARWLRQIFVLITRGGVEERGINISSSVYRHNSQLLAENGNVIG